MTAIRSPVSSRQVGQGSLRSQTTCNFGQANPLRLDFHLGAIVDTIMPTAWGGHRDGWREQSQGPGLLPLSMAE